MIASLGTGHEQEFKFCASLKFAAEVRASDSVSLIFNFVFDRIRSVMASANDNAAQLPAVPGFLTPPSRVVTRGAFRSIPCHEGPGCDRVVSRNELRKLVEHGRAPHPIHKLNHNPAQPGRITARNATRDEESGNIQTRFLSKSPQNF